jgi:peptidoglycan/LPS O-acetylase OafA/YrhL
MRIPKQNNLEWLRLFFAIQVMISHSMFHLRGIDEPWWFAAIPGVPAFFFVSGLLVYASYDNIRELGPYWRNRALRIFPGLIAVASGGVLLVIAAKGYEFAADHLAGISLWFIAQITIGQAYNPAMFRDIGVGVINGSLWTLTAELIFYFCVPFLHFFQRSWRHSVLLLALTSFTVYIFGQYFMAQSGLPPILFDMIRITPIYWGWMFLAGTLAFLHFEKILPFVRHFALALPVLAIWAFIGGEGPFLSSATNNLGILYFLVYSAAIFFLAFGTRYVKLKNDFSYGTYIWHMVVVNSLLVAGYRSVTTAIVLTLLLAITSWFLIERPAMRLKRSSMHAIT